MITNTAYVSLNKFELGRAVDLNAVDEWANLQTEAVLGNVKKAAFCIF
jgi:hypothetical protein